MGIILPREALSPHGLLMGWEDGENRAQKPQNLPPMGGRRHWLDEGLTC